MLRSWRGRKHNNDPPSALPSIDIVHGAGVDPPRAERSFQIEPSSPMEQFLGRSRMNEPQSAFERAQNEVCELFATLAEFWGFTRTQGRIFGLLFLSPMPLGYAAIRDRLEISAGSTSMTIASLVDWGVLERRGRHYVAETNLWKLATGVLRRRERRIVDQALEHIAVIMGLLRSAPEHDDAWVFARERIETLHELFQLGRSFLDAFVTRSPVHGLIGTIARRASKLAPRSHPNRGLDVPLGV